MKNVFKILFIVLCAAQQLFSSELLVKNLCACSGEETVWEETTISPFDEMMVSWSSSRPKKGHFLIQVSVHLPEVGWSDWFDYAFWGQAEQYSFKNSHSIVKVFQDSVEVAKDNKATGFRIKVLAKEGAKLQDFRTLYACLTNIKKHTVSVGHKENVKVLLPVPGTSQMALKDERAKRLCSPTSTSAVVQYLSSRSQNPLEFANNAYDRAFDIYGNWVLNTAHAAAVLDWEWHCFVSRLTSFDDIITSLERGQPVVVSIRGPLPGSALPYESGHLVVVRGYDSQKRRVYCMDPAFSSDEKTLVDYDVNDFVTAWKRRNGVAYLFIKREAP